MITDIEKVIRQYLPHVVHLSLATVSENKPWVCEVHYVYDEDLNLYFRSKRSRRHSKDIEKNKNVAGNIVKQHLVGEKPRGVYFEGAVEELEGVDANHVAYKKYCERLKTGPEILDDARDDDGHKFYKISVTKYYLFDSIDSNPSKKYELVWVNN